ncbi:MAG: IS1182 family transposase [archaeon]|nr:IS1182 family transposase [archaeon]
MAIRDDKMGQSWLLPPAVSDLIPVDHICHLVVAIVNSIDISEVEKKYRFTPGNPAYSRRMLLRLVIMASIDAVWSSRKIAKLTQENVVYMYLTGNEKPDFRTICNFRKENKELIEEVFKKTVTIAKALGILNLGHISTDGTKIKANASNNYTLSKEELEEIRRIIERGIEVDEEEDRLYGEKRGDELPSELDTQEKLRKKIEEIEQASGIGLKSAAKKIIEQYARGDERDKEKVMKKLDKAEEELNKSGQGAVSLTDHEARFMENKKKRTALSYNSQITVDHDSGIILANDVTQDCTDHNQLQPQVEMTEENLGGLPAGRKVSMDNGYFSGVNLRYMEEKGLDGYIPDSKQAQEQKGKRVKDGPYSKEKFMYDEEKDQFICPNGEVLTRKGEYEYNGKPLYTYYGANCTECPYRSECAGEQRRRVITSDDYEAERRRMAAKMQSEEGKEEYKKRKETVEWPFGNIKHNLKFREFLTRGIEKVRTEHNLVCTAHNLKVMWAKMAGKVAVLGKIGSLIANSASKARSFFALHPTLD